MTSHEESDRQSYEDGSAANKGLALFSYRLGVMGGAILGIGASMEAYAIATDSPTIGLISFFPIAFGAFNAYSSQQDIEREIGWALEDKAKASPPIETSSGVME